MITALAVGAAWVIVAAVAAGVIGQAIRAAEARRTAAAWVCPDTAAELIALTS